MHVSVTRFVPEDIPRLLEWINGQPETIFYQWGGDGVGLVYPLTVEQMEKHYREADVPRPTRIFYKAVEVASSSMLGYLELNRIDYNNRHAAISRVIVDPQRQGRGIGFRMLSRVVEIGFREFRLHRIALGVFDFNRSAISCYERVGFVREGVTREIQKVGDEYWNAVQMSILEHEWDAGRGAGK